MAKPTGLEFTIREWERMDSIETIRAFVAVAQSKSFTKAAEALDLAPSIVTKRVAQLEHLLGVSLLQRTTRKVSLTGAGDHHLAQLQSILKSYDETLRAIRKGPDRLAGSLRIKLPLTLGSLRLEKLLRNFTEEHPEIELEVLLLDGPLNPTVEGIDIAITAFPMTFDGVVDEFLWPLKRSVYASPRYLETHDPIEHPRQLERHPIAAYQPTGSSWQFLAATGVISVAMRPRLSSNNMAMLLRTVEDGSAIGLLSDYVAVDAVARGTVVRILEEFPIPDLWIKAMIPETRLNLPRVQAALASLRSWEPPNS